MTRHSTRERASTIIDVRNSGCSSAWLEHQTGGLGVGGSNPLTLTGRRIEPFGAKASKGFLVRARFMSRRSFIVSAAQLIQRRDMALAAGDIANMIALAGRRGAQF